MDFWYRLKDLGVSVRVFLVCQALDNDRKGQKSDLCDFLVLQGGDCNY